MSMIDAVISWLVEWWDLAALVFSGALTAFGLGYTLGARRSMQANGRAEYFIHETFHNLAAVEAALVDADRHGHLDETKTHIVKNVATLRREAEKNGIEPGEWAAREAVLEFEADSEGARWFDDVEGDGDEGERES